MASLKALKPFLLPAIAVALIVNANISKDAEREEVYKNSSLASKACTKEKQRRQEKLNSSRRWEGKFKCTLKGN